MPQGRIPDRRKSVVRSLLRVLQRRSKIFHSVLHAKGRRPCQKARKPHLTHCRSIYYIYIYQTFPYFCGMKKDFNTGLRKGIEADRVKLARRRKLLLREMGGSATHYGLPALPEPFLRACGLHRVCTVGKLLRPVPFIYVIIN